MVDLLETVSEQWHNAEAFAGEGEERWENKYLEKLSKVIVKNWGKLH